MAAILRNMGVYLGLVEDDAYGDPDSVESDRNSAHEQTPANSRARHPDGAALARSGATEYSRATGSDHAGSGRDHAPDSEAYPAEYAEYEPVPYRITTLHPRTYNEAVTIGEHFRSGTPVIMNLGEMADADAKRLVDFAAGLTFGLHGRVERVTAKVFLLSPQNVTVTAQDKARIAENGFFNQS